jgi:hypothetical protein
LQGLTIPLLISRLCFLLWFKTAREHSLASVILKPASYPVRPDKSAARELS